MPNEDERRIEFSGEEMEAGRSEGGDARGWLGGRQSNRPPAEKFDRNLDAFRAALTAIVLPIVAVSLIVDGNTVVGVAVLVYLVACLYWFVSVD